MLNQKFPLQRNEALREGIVFLASFLIVGLALYFIFSPLEMEIQKMETGHVQFILGKLGIDTSAAEIPFQFWMNGKVIEISSLCSGLVEMILLASAMLVTPNASFRKKILGMVIGVLILYGFNLIRMVVTLLQLEHTSFSFAEFTHDVLFRLVLILGFALLYAAWLNCEKITLFLRSRGMVG